MSKGRQFYVPNIFVEEVEYRKKKDGVSCNTKIIEEIVCDARIGKEQKRLMRSFGFNVR